MSNIIITVGPPGCGKTIWAKLYIENHKAKRLNRDDFRSMMQNSDYNAKDEKVIKNIRNYAVESWLQMGYDVVVDDTNLTPDVFPIMEKIARRVGDVGVREHFITIERDICWYNNTHRSVGVIPEEAWNGLWLKYTHYQKNDDYYAPPKAIQVEMFLNEYQVTTLPHAMIIDLDETLALHKANRNPFNHTQIPDDMLNSPLSDIVHPAGGTRIIVTGRTEASREATEKWLTDNEVEWDLLYMRPLGQDYEHDFKIKKQIYEEKIKDKYFIFAVFEDRERNTELWRDLGLPVYQTNFGRY